MITKDKYLYFTFNNISSSRYRCFYENSGEELLFPAFPQFQNQIITPLYQPFSYYTGNHMSPTKFNLKCAAESLTEAEFRQLSRWLNKDSIGWLKFDFIKNYHYLVKVDSFSNVLFLPIDESKTIYHVEFTVGFITVEDPAAISDYTYNYNLSADNSESTILDFEYRLPVIDFNPYRDDRITDYNDTVRLFNMQPYPFFPKLSIKDTNSVQIDLFSKRYHNLSYKEKRPKKWYGYNLDTNSFNLEIDSKYGYVKNEKTQNLIEEDFLSNLQVQDSFINNGAFSVEPGNLLQHNLTLKSVNPYFDKDRNPQIELTFTTNEPWYLDDYDYGYRDKELIQENKNFKGIFIQNEGFDKYPLFNEGPYGDGYYYVDGQYTFYSYYFVVEGNSLKVVLNNLGTNLNDFDNYINYFKNKVNQNFIVSICDYTEIDFHTFLNKENSTLNSINNIEFNLRTIF